MLSLLFNDGKLRSSSNFNSTDSCVFLTLLLLLVKLLLFLVFNIFCNFSFSLFFQLLDAMTYMHKMNICHRNIRTEHILFNKNNRPKIIGFGYSTFYEPKKKFLVHMVLCVMPAQK